MYGFIKNIYYNSNLLPQNISCINGLTIVKYKNNYIEWYLNGKLHREDGPAVEYAIGNKLWYLNGKLHREDGPAVEYADGDKAWYLNGKNLTETEWKAKLKNNL